ncbi:phospholipase D delta [Tanacetum coccineum]
MGCLPPKEYLASTVMNFLIILLNVSAHTQTHGNNEKITAFIGFLDLCDGRYDTPEHRLFHDLDTVSKDDIHQPTILQRWRKATKWRELALVAKQMAHWQDDALSHFVLEDDPLLHVSEEDDPDNWHVEIFWSIDSGSVKGFPKIMDVVEVNQEQSLVNDSLRAELARCKQEMVSLERNKVKHDLDQTIIQHNKRNAELEEENVLLKSKLSQNIESINSLKNESKKVVSDLEDKYLEEILDLYMSLLVREPL